MGLKNGVKIRYGDMKCGSAREVKRAMGIIRHSANTQGYEIVQREGGEQAPRI